MAGYEEYAPPEIKVRDVTSKEINAGPWRRNCQGDRWSHMAELFHNKKIAMVYYILSRHLVAAKLLSESKLVTLTKECQTHI